MQQSVDTGHQHDTVLRVIIAYVVSRAVDDEAVAKQMADRQELDNDSQVLEQIIELAAKLKSPHQVRHYIYIYIYIASSVPVHNIKLRRVVAMLL